MILKEMMMTKEVLTKAIARTGQLGASKSQRLKTAIEELLATATLPVKDINVTTSPSSVLITIYTTDE